MRRRFVRVFSHRRFPQAAFLLAGFFSAARCILQKKALPQEMFVMGWNFGCASCCQLYLQLQKRHDELLAWAEKFVKLPGNTTILTKAVEESRHDAIAKSPYN